MPLDNENFEEDGNRRKAFLERYILSQKDVCCLSLK